MHYLLVSLLCCYAGLGLRISPNHPIGRLDHPLGRLTGIPAEKSSSGEKPTVIYVVRHAEKMTTDPSNQDPDLSREGYQRAQALRKLLQGKNVQAGFVTPYQRTRLTLSPLAEEKGFSLQTYQPHDYQALTRTIRKQCAGQVVVVIGHSNSVLEIIEAFGAKRPVKTLTDMDYDYLFEVTLPKRGKPTVEAGHYGVSASGVH